MTNELQGVSLHSAEFVTNPAILPASGPTLGIVAGDHPDIEIVPAHPGDMPVVHAPNPNAPIPLIPQSDLPELVQRYEAFEKLFDTFLKEAGFPGLSHGPGEHIIPGLFNVPNMGPGGAAEPAHFPQPLTVINPEHVTMDDPTHGF